MLNEYLKLTTILLVGIGSIIMLFGIKHSLANIKLLKSTKKPRNVKRWYIIFYLVVFFQLGYFGTIALLILDITSIFILLIGSIFLFGALFVLTLSYLSQVTMKNVISSEQKIREYTNVLKELNISFERFVPKEALSQMGHDNILNVKLGDQKEKEMTIMFTDIRSFTKLSESMSPRENFAFLNNLLRYISPVIRDHDGFIDKFIGDGIMALFPNKPNDAIQSAIEIFNNLNDYNTEHKDNDPIRIGIGVHIGKLIIGTIGERNRMESTVISSAVNITSRLEALTKDFGVGIIITKELACTSPNSKFLYRNLGNINIRGKKDKIELMEVYNIDSKEQIELKTKTLEMFQKAVAYLEENKIQEAQDAFKDILAVNPHDNPSRRYFNLCKEQLKQISNEKAKV